MNKILKLCALGIFMLMALILLTGCGDKVKATITEEDVMFGEYGIDVQISFKDDKINKVKMTYELEDENKAAALVGFGNLALGYCEEGAEAEYEQKKNKVTIRCNAEGFYQLYDEDYRDLNKNETIEELKNDGFTIE